VHWQKSGLDIVTSAVNQYQLWFGAGPFFIKLLFQFNIFVFNLASAPGRRAMNPCPSPMQNVNCKFFFATEYILNIDFQ
jgi:hypothetical protein